MTARTGHLSEADLVLHFYGEGSQPAAIDRHLALCDACKREYDAIAGTLTMVATPATPERGDLYGLEVWQRIRPLLPPPDPWSRVRHVRWSTVMTAAAIAVFGVLAFIGGRNWPSNDHTAAAKSQAATPRFSDDERARTVAIIDHLERSERVLLDLANADGSDVDIREEQSWAAALVDANRLYREAATQAGETATALVLDDLERSLLDIVHAPSALTDTDLGEVGARLDAAALLFKVRVLSGQLRERQIAPLAPRKTT